MNIPRVLLLLGFTNNLAVAQFYVLPELNFKSPAVFCVNGSCDSSSHPLGLDAGDLMSGSGGAPDGFPDIVVVAESSSVISVFRNNAGTTWTPDPPSGGLTRVQTLDVTSAGAVAPYSVKLADMDGDNDLDIVASVALTNGGGVLVYYNSGNGSFSTSSKTLVSLEPVTGPPALAGLTSAFGLQVKDFNVDGKPDIVIGGKNRRTETAFTAAVAVVWAPSAGWQPGSAAAERDIIRPLDVISGYPAGGEAHGVAVGKVCPTQLGGGDIAFTIVGLQSVFIMRNLNGGPGAAWSYSDFTAVNSEGIDFAKLRAGTVLNDLPLADSFADGQGNHKAWILRSNDNCSYAPIDEDTSWPTTPRPKYVINPPLHDAFGLDAGKIDIGNSIDVVIACQHGTQGTQWEHGGIVVWQGRNNGNYYTDEPNRTGAPRHFLVEPAGNVPKPCFVIIADMNDDGKNDIVTSNATSGNISVLINITTVSTD